MPVFHHGDRPSRIDPALSTATHVFLRVDAVRRPLVPPYLGPFEVLQRSEKTFIILQNGRRETVTIDRLKPAAPLPDSMPVNARPPSVSRAPVPSDAAVGPVPSRPLAPLFPPAPAPAPPLRSGRVPRPVSRYQA